MSKAVAKKNSEVPAIADDALAIFEENAGVGFEQATSDDFVLPFIRKVEAMSKCLIKTHANYIEGASSGQLAHTVMKQCWDKVYMIPVKYDNMLQHYKFPEGSGGWIANYRFDDAQVPSHSKVEKDGKVFRVPNDQQDSYLQQTFNYIGLFFDPDMNPLGPAILPMEKSQCRTARQFNVLLNSKRITLADGSKIKAPIFSHIYEITLQSITNDMGSFFSYAYSSGEVVTDKELLLEAVELAKTLKDVDTTAIHDKDEDEGDEVPFEVGTEV